MSARRATADYARLASLQALAALESRRAVEAAVTETDRREQSLAQAGDELARAESAYADLHALGSLCPTRMLMHGAILNFALEGHDVETAAFRSAQNVEREASELWLRDEHRTEWFNGRARTQARRQQRERDGKAEDAVRSLRIALAREVTL